MNSNNINNRRSTLLPGNYSESLSPAMAINEVVSKNEVPATPPQSGLLLATAKKISPVLAETRTTGNNFFFLGKHKDGTSAGSRQELLWFKLALSEDS